MKVDCEYYPNYQRESKIYLVFSGDLPVFLRSKNYIEIFIRFFHPVLFPGKFFKIMIIGLQFMKLLFVIFNPFNIIFPVDFKLMQFSHLLISGNKIVRIEKQNPDNKNNYCQEYLFLKTGGIFSIKLNLIIMIQTYNYFFNLHSSDIASVHYLHHE